MRVFFLAVWLGLPVTGCIERWPRIDNNPPYTLRDTITQITDRHLRYADGISVFHRPPKT